jgi:Tfp pilus assembly protein PilF
MSLLLDALKRAEQEKHSRNGERPPARISAPPAAPAAANSPTGALELQPLGGGSAQQSRESAAHAAQVVFQAKIDREAAASNRGVLWATIGMIAIVVVAAGAYVWYSLHMLTPQLVAASTVRPPSAPTPAPASGMPVGELSVASAAPASRLVIAPAEVEVRREAPPPRTAAMLASELLKDAATPAAPEPLRLARTPEPVARVPAEITAGYEALRGGDLPTARRGYQAALTADPRSLDAHLGMATVEARSGNRPAAAGHYRKALDVDPRNATALAGLAALADYGRAEGLESRLREDIARNPASAPLHLALGNMFASQSRWHDAQAEYFEAHRLDPAAADVSYNLAVSLDHLGQGRLAAEQYRKALEAAASQPAQFDRLEVQQRLAQLAAAPR